MKRTELRRVTPLRSSLVERGSSPLHEASTPDPALPKHGRTRLRPVSPKRAKQGGARQKKLRWLRAIDERCAFCGSPFRLHGHERLALAQGGKYEDPDCLLCDPHNGLMEDEPEWAAYTGWKISGRYPRSPSLAPNEAVRLDGSIYTFPNLDAS